jgi:hypothetical protein
MGDGKTVRQRLGVWWGEGGGGGARVSLAIAIRIITEKTKYARKRFVTSYLE